MILDLSHEACPVPLVKSRRAMDKMGTGETLEIVVADEDSEVNITMAAKELGIAIERIRRDDDGKWHITVGKR